MQFQATQEGRYLKFKCFTFKKLFTRSNTNTGTHSKADTEKKTYSELYYKCRNLQCQWQTMKQKGEQWIMKNSAQYTILKQGKQSCHENLCCQQHQAIQARSKEGVLILNNPK